MTFDCARLGFERDPKNGVLRPKSGIAHFAYSDGPAEAYLSRVFEDTQDLATGSFELAQRIQDWATQYHLSQQRADLLRPVSHYLAGDVLEIGSGAGALTRFLSETAKHVVAVEGAMPRAALTRKRCRDVLNVDVVCANAFDLNLGQAFDAVTLIGVLEYSRMFGTAEDPIDALLKHCFASLRDSGTLVLAIENQLGLKYLAGAPEDHLGRPFFGINDRYRAQQPVTFGRHELQTRLENAGFCDVTFKYPFPDYKMPNCIFTEDALADSNDLISNLACRMTARNQAHPYSRSFAEEASIPAIARNRMLGQLANSFLVTARRSAAAKDLFSEGPVRPLAWIFSTQRDRPFAKETLLQKREGAIEVARRRLYPKYKPSKGSLNQIPCAVPFLKGEVMLRSLTRILNDDGWSPEQIATWALPWLNLLKERSQTPEGHDLAHVPGDAIDFAPGNLIMQNGRLLAFDQEWSLNDEIPLVWPLWRGLFHAINAHCTVAPPEPGTPLSVQELTTRVMSLLGEALFPAEVDSLGNLEAMYFDSNRGALAAQTLTVRGTSALVPRPVRANSPSPKIVPNRDRTPLSTSESRPTSH